MPLNRKILIIPCLLALLLSACAGAADETVDANVLMTQSVGTMVASFFGTQTAMYTPPLPTVTGTETRFPTPTSGSTATFVSSPTTAFLFNSSTPGSITPTGTLSTATINPGSLAVGCNNLAFVRDVTLPPGTVVQKGQDLTKTWKVENNGSCSWMYQYTLTLLSGDSYGANNVKLQKLVVSGHWAELSVHMTAPNKPGTYANYWRLSNGQSMFGATLAVSFVVAVPSSTSAAAATATPTSTVTLTLVPTTVPSVTPTPTETTTTP